MELRALSGGVSFEPSGTSVRDLKWVPSEVSDPEKEAVQALRDERMWGRDGPLDPSPLSKIYAARSQHPFWTNRLFQACAAGALTREDYRTLFSQYYLYSLNFTRFLSALMTNCESDLHRSALAGNLWQEGGGAAPEHRHAEIFRRFLRDGLGVDIEAIEFLDSTRLFVREYLDFCRYAPPLAGSAFLALGTEGIVPRMYSVFLDGLLGVGLPHEHTEFFRIHIACDDDHARTLEDMVMSYRNTPNWYGTSLGAMDFALRLRERFFEQIFDVIQARRLHDLVGAIQGGRSLAETLRPLDLCYRAGTRGAPLYENVHEGQGIDFSVERVPFATDVFDPRFLRVAPHRNTERHRHPHESVFFIICGTARVVVDGDAIEVGPGDLVFVPRWATHQSFNTSAGELLILALTDFGLTERVFIGDHLKATRLKGTQASRPDRPFAKG